MLGQAHSELISIGSLFAHRQWFLGTSGNMSALISRVPLLFSITGNGLDKGSLAPESFVTINEKGEPSDGGFTTMRPSGEYPVHTRIYECTDAQCVIHVHVFSALLVADLFGFPGSVNLQGLEILKGLGCSSASDCLHVPIIANQDDPTVLAREIVQIVEKRRDAVLAPAVIVSGHGMFVWGDSVFAAKRHVELLTHGFEYLLLKNQPRLCY